MNRSIVFLYCSLLLTPVILNAQQDSTAIVDRKVVTLKEVVVPPGSGTQPVVAEIVTEQVGQLT